jgi:hypothetical protein
VCVTSVSNFEYSVCVTVTVVTAACQRCGCLLRRFYLASCAMWSEQRCVLACAACRNWRTVTVVQRQLVYSHWILNSCIPLHCACTLQHEVAYQILLLPFANNQLPCTVHTMILQHHDNHTQPTGHNSISSTTALQ